MYLHVPLHTLYFPLNLYLYAYITEVSAKKRDWKKRNKLCCTKLNFSCSIPKSLHGHTLASPCSHSPTLSHPMAPMPYASTPSHPHIPYHPPPHPNTAIPLHPHIPASHHYTPRTPGPCPSLPHPNSFTSPYLQFSRYSMPHIPVPSCSQPNVPQSFIFIFSHVHIWILPSYVCHLY